MDGRQVFDLLVDGGASYNSDSDSFLWYKSDYLELLQLSSSAEDFSSPPKDSIMVSLSELFK